MPVCAQLKMILGDMTNTPTTAAHPARTARNVHSKQTDDDNARENACDHDNPNNSCDNRANMVLDGITNTASD